jgi:hypothetical protein
MTAITTSTLVRRSVVILIAGAAVAVVANQIVAASALAAGATPGFAPLSLPVFGGFTIAGLLVGYAGWRLVIRRSGRPAVLLRALVPILLVLSFVPDIAVLATGAIPGTSTAGMIGLMIMHLVVAGVAIPVYRILAPASAR